MSHWNFPTRLRQVALAAMFCLVAASGAASSSNESGTPDTSTGSSFSGYIIAVG
jgi:hypothetical protein